MTAPVLAHVARGLLTCTILCAAASTAEAGSWSQRTVAGMTVQIYVPDSAGSYPAGRGLMVGLHGCTQQATALRDRGNWTAAAESYGVVIALPQVPNGGVIAGCWDYYGSNHTRSTRHDGNVLQLVSSLLGDGTLRIDAAQVYVSGLSSGGGEAMVLGCLAPDVFSGVGINAGPTVGTASSEIARVSTTQAAAVAACRRLAGAQSGAFDTQLVSVIYGTQDFVVAQGYGQLNAEVFAELYGARTQSTLDVAQMPGFMPRGMAAAWADGEGERIQRIIVDGMGHAFPSGSGDSFEMSFIAARGVAWPAQMLAQFTLHNRRAQGTANPTDAGVSPRVDAGTPPGRDAGTLPGLDAGTPPRTDAGTVRTDAGTVPGRDASTTSDDDAGNSSNDDAGGSDAGGMTGGKVEGSGCSTHPAGLLDLAVALGLFATLGRWRSRRAAR